ncbi:MAG TPA: hypothetical protein VJ276_17755 [Thermoanaerobaculia bacterium]|nr:hypothetical protein [Thermoanaerobaculia bacterium]
MSAARTSLFGIFVLAGRPLSAAQVIALAAPLGITASNVKSHLTRMVADGSLRRSGPVRKATYQPSEQREGVIAGIRGRLDDSPPEPWDGAWLMLSLRLTGLRRADREELLASLWLDGFRPCGGTTFIRPAWPAAWAASRAAAYLGSLEGACIRGEPLLPVDAAALYELDALDRRAMQLADWIARQRIPHRHDARAFALRLRVGGRVVAVMGHNPRLPPAVWGKRNGMRRLAASYRRFERRIAPLAARFVEDVTGA